MPAEIAAQQPASNLERITDALQRLRDQQRVPPRYVSPRPYEPPPYSDRYHRPEYESRPPYQHEANRPLRPGPDYRPSPPQAGYPPLRPGPDYRPPYRPDYLPPQQPYAPEYHYYPPADDRFPIHGTISPRAERLASSIGTLVSRIQSSVTPFANVPEARSVAVNAQRVSVYTAQLRDLAAAGQAHSRQASAVAQRLDEASDLLENDADHLEDRVDDGRASRAQQLAQQMEEWSGQIDQLTDAFIEEIRR
jgi:hypothetical protein